VVSAYVLNRVWGLHQGFESYDDEFGPSDPHERADLHEQRDGSEVVAAAERWLDGVGDARFFLWLHFYDPHWPYEAPPRFASRYPDDPYAAEIAYTDELVGQVLDSLRRRGRYASTLIAVTGDHGEGLGQHGEPDHGIYLYDSTLHVPLILRTPLEAYRGVVTDLTRDIDIAPTILDYLGVPAPPSFHGRSLLPLAAGRSGGETPRAYSESLYVRYHYGWKEPVAARDARFKYIDLPEPELYDLRDDPGETRNVVERHPDVVADLRGWLDGIRAGAETPQPQELDPEALERLQSLGYLGGAAPAADGELPDPKQKADVLDLLIAASRATGKSLRSGRFREAIDVVERALAVEPGFMDGWQFLGTLYVKDGRPDEAIAALEHILALNPESLPARDGLAKAYRAKGDLGTALDLLQAIAASSPSYAGAYYEAADMLVEAGRYDEAATWLRRFLDLHPDAVRAWYETGTIRLRQGRLEPAREAIERALSLAPSIRSAHFNLALIAEQRGDGDGAQVEYERELALFPDSYEALANLGVLLMQRGEGARGTATFERLLELRPQDARANYLLARAYFSAGRTDDRVLELARTAARLDPRLQRAQELVAAILARRPGKG